MPKNIVPKKRIRTVGDLMDELRKCKPETPLALMTEIEGGEQQLEMGTPKRKNTMQRNQNDSKSKKAIDRIKDQELPEIKNPGLAAAIIELSRSRGFSDDGLVLCMFSILHELGREGLAEANAEPEPEDMFDTLDMAWHFNPGTSDLKGYVEACLGFDDNGRLVCCDGKTVKAMTSLECIKW